MLTQHEVRSAAAGLGLGEYADGLIEALRPVYRLDASPRGAHRVGGVPDLVAGERWPRSVRGVELTFIAQIDTSLVPPLPGLDDEAVEWLTAPAFVRLFTDIYDNPFEPNQVVALVADPQAARARRPPRRAVHRAWPAPTRSWSSARSPNSLSTRSRAGSSTSPTLP